MTNYNVYESKNSSFLGGLISDGGGDKEGGHCDGFSL